MSSSASLKVFETLAASWPIIESTTEENLIGSNLLVDLLEFIHQLGIDLQSAGRIENDGIQTLELRHRPRHCGKHRPDWRVH